MRFLVWVCRVALVVVIAAFVAIIFNLTHGVGADMDSAMPALNWITVVGTALLGLTWALMRSYWQAFLLLVGLGVIRALFGFGPGLSTLDEPLLTGWQSDFLWVSIGVVLVSLVAALAIRAVLGDRAARAMRRAAPTVATGQAVAVGTAAALQEVPAGTEAAPIAPPAETPDAPEAAPEPPEAPAKTDESDSKE